MAEILKPDYENAASNIAVANFTVALEQLSNTSIAKHRESAGLFSNAGSGISVIIGLVLVGIMLYRMFGGK